jgi:predicted metal-dependent phosphotriesterase family hydrolase
MTGPRITDYGWTTAVPHRARGMVSFLEWLWQHGLSEDDLTTMAARNPARLFGLEG